MRIRRLNPEDAALAVALVRRFKDRNITPARMGAFLQIQRNLLYAAEIEGQPVGFALAYRLDRLDRDAPMMLLYEIEVAADHRRHGIGRALLGELRRDCAEMGCLKMWVLTDEANRAARGLYASTGAARNPGDMVLFEYLEFDQDRELE